LLCKKGFFLRRGKKGNNEGGKRGGESGSAAFFAAIKRAWGGEAKNHFRVWGPEKMNGFEMGNIAVSGGTVGNRTCPSIGLNLRTEGLGRPDRKGKRKNEGGSFLSLEGGGQRLDVRSIETFDMA